MAPKTVQQVIEQNQGLTEFELERLARIKRNRQVLCELGLENAGQMMAPKPKKPKTALPKQQTPKQLHEPTRQSRRIRGDTPELDVLSRRRRHEQDENEAGEAEYTTSSSKRSKRNTSSRPQQDEQQYSSWDGRIDKAAVEALLKREPDNPHHMHNIDRLRSMSCKALVTRVRRITNMGKLQSFIKVMHAAGGPEEVLEAAQEALNAVTVS